ncbi:hypothetical protein ACHAXR_001868, partial [Thalassiosira sp. AJA248-18]
MGRRIVKFQRDPDDSFQSVSVRRFGGGREIDPEEMPTATEMRNMMTPYSGIVQKYINQDKWVKNIQKRRSQQDPIFGTSQLVDEDLLHQQQLFEQDVNSLNTRQDDDLFSITSYVAYQWDRSPAKEPLLRLLRLSLIFLAAFSFKHLYNNHLSPHYFRSYNENVNDPENLVRPRFVYEHPYVTSSYYTSTSNTRVLEKTLKLQIEPKKSRPPDRERGIVSRLAILRPFCEFDAEALPTTFACWNSLVPCRAAEMDLGDEEEDVDEWVLFDTSVDGTGRKLEKEEEDDWECDAYYENNNNSSWIRGIANNLFKRCKRKPRPKDYFDDVSADGLRTTSADLFLFYSQTFAENEEAMVAVDKIMEEFYSPGGWSRCFDNIYAVEANIPMELDLY